MEKIKVNLFGCIQLTNGLKSINENEIHSNRLLTLLSYLILHRNEQIQNKVLYKQFIGDWCKNPEGTLKNLMYRLRCMLKELGSGEYICTLINEYRWNPEIPVEVDCERFEELHAEICVEQDTEKKKELCIEAVDCYKNNFSSIISEERWIAPWRVQNEGKYIEIVRLLSDIYIEENQWSELEELCRKALVSEPFEEDIHSNLVKSLQCQKKYNQAMEHYENAKKIFYENLGIWNPKKLEESFNTSRQDLKTQVKNIEALQEEFCELGQINGVFFCDYNMFLNIYQLEARRLDRMCLSEHLLLLTVRHQGGLRKDGVFDESVKYGIEMLEKILRRMLRAGDVAARSSQTQFVVLLSGCSYEAGIMVAERIHRDFRRKMRNYKLELRYELGEITFSQQKSEVE